MTVISPTTQEKASVDHIKSLTPEVGRIGPGPAVRSRDRADAAKLRRHIGSKASVGVVLVVVDSSLIKDEIGISSELDGSLTVGKRDHAVVGGANGSLHA